MLRTAILNSEYKKVYLLNNNFFTRIQCDSVNDLDYILESVVRWFLFEYLFVFIYATVVMLQLDIRF